MTPTLMKAVVKTGLDKVEIQSVKVPHPGPGQVLVKVFAAAQNPSDCSFELYFQFLQKLMLLWLCRDETEDCWVG